MIFEFSDCQFDVDRRLLRRNGDVVSIEPLVFNALLYLIENRDRVVSRDELIDKLWDGRIVSDSALSSNIKAIRAAIGDTGKAQTMVKTLHGVGFRFVDEVIVQDNSQRSEARTTALEAPGHTSPEIVMRGKPSLAILPISLAAPNDTHSDFVDGLTSDISTALVRTGAFFVANLNSSSITQSVQVPLEAQVAQYGVRYFLNGTLRISGEKFRLNMRLVDSSDREEVWAERIDGEIGDPFAAQDMVTGAVVGALQPNILFAEVRRAVRESQEDADAYSRLMRTIPQCLSLDRDQNAAAIEELRWVIGQRKDYGLAHALLSWCYGQQVSYGWTEISDVTKATALHHARFAYQLNPDDGLVLIILGNAECTSGNISAAETYVTRGLKLDPNSAWGWHRMGYIHTYLGRSRRAIECFERSLELSPLDPMRANLMVGMALAHFNGENYKSALEWLDAGMQENPDMIWAHRLVSVCAALDGQSNRASASFEIINDYMQDASIEEIMKAVPHRNDDMRKRYREGLQKAGYREFSTRS